MAMLSEGDFLGDFVPVLHQLISPRWSAFPTIGIRFFLWNFDGGYSLPNSYNGSFHSPSNSESNYPHKPPWFQLYKSSNSISLLSLSNFNSPRSLPPQNMSDRLRKSVQDLNLGIDDEPVALTPEFCSQAAYVNRFSVVVTTVNPRKQNLRALIGQMPRVWGFPDSCVGRILERGKSPI